MTQPAKNNAFAVESFTEIDEDEQAGSGQKHWHYFEVIGRKW